MGIGSARRVRASARRTKGWMVCILAVSTNCTGVSLAKSLLRVSEEDS